MESEIKRIISSMTLEEKVGQLFMEYNESKYEVLPHVKQALKEGIIGSIIYFSGCNVEDGVQLSELSIKVQEASKKSKYKLPAIIAIDQEGGQLAAVRKKAVITPGNMAIAATNSIDDARVMGEITGAQLKAMNVNVNLAPVVDTACNLDVPVTSNRFFASDPELVGKMGAAYVKGCQSKGISACLKHFPGQSNSEKDTHWHLDVIDKSLEELERNELLPFKMGIAAGVDSVLTIHAMFPALDKDFPATLSEKIINGVLRKKLGFNNLVITDDVYMKAIKDHYGVDEAAYLAINAGCDIVMGAAGTKTMHQYVIKKIREGKLSIDKIHSALERVLRFKFKYCTDITPVSKAKKILENKKFEQMSQQVADNSITLIRNNEGLLPLKLKKNDIICIIQPGMIRLEMSDAVNLYDENILKKEIMKRHKNVREVVIGLEPNKEELISIFDNAFISDVIIACTQNAFKYCPQVKMIKELKELADAKNKKLITVALRSPSDLAWYPEVETHIVTYGNWDCQMRALVKVLFGEIKPKGKLPVPIKGLYNVGYSFTGKPKKKKKKIQPKNLFWHEREDEKKEVKNEK